MGQVRVEHDPDRKKLEEMGVFNWPIWEKEPLKFDWSYDTQEVCYILEGKARIEQEDGEPVEFGAGDLVIFPAGLNCVWNVIEKIKKHYSLG